MRWRKLGRLFVPRPLPPYLVSHAANPLAVPIAGDVYRVFYSGRDDRNRSSVGWVDIDLARRAVIRVADRPVFTFGPAGSFYSHGVSIGNCYTVAGTRYMLFMGWQVPPAGHWRGDIGRLVVGDDLSLQLDPVQPLLATDPVDPLSLSYPWVMPWADGYRMWYGSTVAWDAGNGEMLHVLNSAGSADGHDWHRHGLAVPYEPGRAQAFSRPSVLAGADGYEMWFSYRGDPGRGYRIGYATSRTGSDWQLRLAASGIDVADSGWDAEMIEYPFVFDHRGDRYMLYNGNGFGRSGFGLAVLDRA